MNRALRFLAQGLLALLVAGCAALDPAAERYAAADRIVGEAVHASRSPAAEQRAALARAQEAFSRSATLENRVRLAALLATLGSPLRDDARAAELLEPVAEAGVPGPRRLAALLLAHVGERQRAAREAERLQRERQAADKERERREEAMRQQIEALRGIERGILEREEKLRPRPR